MFDCFNRNINYLRISITDRCNLRCHYCMPEEGVPLISHHRIMPYEKIAEVMQEAVTLGIDKVRITGGEPLVRKDVGTLVSMIAVIPGIRDFGMTTNGILLETFAPALKEAGLHRVNISLDAIDPKQYRELTRGGDVARVLRGIEAAKQAGLTPVKINCVVQASSNERNARDVAEYCRDHNLEVRFIHQMNLEHGCFTTVEGGDGGDCSRCSRLRLTANGKIKPCLFNDLEFDIHELGIREALVKAINQKPEKGTVNTMNAFNNIGG